MHPISIKAPRSSAKHHRQGEPAGNALAFAVQRMKTQHGSSRSFDQMPETNKAVSKADKQKAAQNTTTNQQGNAGSFSQPHNMG